MSPSGYPDYPTSLLVNQGNYIDDIRRYTLLTGYVENLSFSLTSISSATLFTDMDDNELNEIREKRMAALKEKMEHQSISGGVIQIDQQHINDLLRNHPALIIDFWAEWCGACQRVGPAIEELLRNFPVKLRLENVIRMKTSNWQCNSIYQRSRILFFSHTGKWSTG